MTKGFSKVETNSNNIRKEGEEGNTPFKKINVFD